MEPVDTILDHLIAISNQLIQSSTHALASTIHSRDSLSTLNNIQHLLDRSIANKQEELNQKLDAIQSHQLALDQIQDQLNSLWPTYPQQQQQQPQQQQKQQQVTNHSHMHYHQFIHPIKYAVVEQEPPSPHHHHHRNRSHSSASSQKMELRTHPNRISQSTIHSTSTEYTSPTSQLVSPSIPSIQSDCRSILLHHQTRHSLDINNTHPPLPIVHSSPSPSSSSLAALLSPLTITKKASSILSAFSPNTPSPAPFFLPTLSRPASDRMRTHARHSISTLRPSLLAQPTPPTPQLALNIPLALDPTPPTAASLHHELKIAKSDHYPP
ncbi:hypothetical protein PCANC_06419 [Puccinia coronata f. sp. avenae]|uniref:Uncharacterized protein n=1 Tax=Puccinia coronata f. sp. avenae TaxID=200324 RepID=A0A2N5T5A6_9BASI|nr:hypothetical protein PCANC_07401 [Puccinia coronata f. sp. avenae]PLW54091.1 hypothetical protein PCANC_06419 [Puccinia coronata f. sp. avenae]